VAAGDREHLLREPAALAPEPGREQLVGDVSPAAEAYGVHAGMRLGEALARCPQLALVPPDPVGVADAWETALTRLESIGAAVEAPAPGQACFDARGLRRLHGGHLDGVLAATRAALRRPARIGARIAGRALQVVDDDEAAIVRRRQEARAALLQRSEEAAQRAKEARAELYQVLAPAPPTLKVGAWVRYSGFDKDVEILELHDKEALVAAGIMKMRVPLSELSGSRTAKPQQKFPERNKQEAAMKKATAVAPAEIKATNFRCDVRGMRADEALTELEEFLDQGMRSGEEAALIIHGHGTGALKQAIRDYLTNSPYIRMFRPGESHEGGDGVTVVALRA